MLGDDFMTREDVMTAADSWWMYLLGAIVVFFVIITSVFFILKAFRDAKKLNMDKAVLKKVIFNSVIFSILPSISILIGVIALATYIGIALPWIRLSVIGALHYEGSAIKATLSSFAQILKLDSLTTVMNYEQFVTVAFVMTLGIIVGPLFCLVGFELYDKKVLAKTRELKEKQPEVVESEVKDDNDKPEKPKKDLGTMIFNGLFIAMICAYLSEDIILLFVKPEDSGFDVYVPTGYVPLIVMTVTFISMYLLDVIEKKFKQKWLASFSFGFSMIIGMAVAAVVEWLVK
jgi:hypothetical protein